MRVVYAASGKARSAASRHASAERIVTSACSRTRSSPRTRSGSNAHSCLSRPNSRSTAPRLRYSLRERSDSVNQLDTFDGELIGLSGKLGNPPLLIGNPNLPESLF